MSRCFPFPPPGYEKKSRPDDADLLKKEQHREKKHIKERKAKEKREGKERREKDKSDGKHRDKKDKKEKHRDKKKDKEKDRDKDKRKDKDKDNGKASGSGKKNVLQTDIYNEDDSKKERIGDSGKSIIPDERKLAAAQFQSRNGGKPIQNSLVAGDVEGFKFVQELNRRIGDEQKKVNCQLVEKFTGTDRKKDAGMEKSAFREKDKDGRVDNRKMDGQETRNVARFSRNGAMAQDVGEFIQSRVDGTPRLLEENSEKRMAEEKKVKIEFEHKQGDKRKDKDREKKIKAKDKDREKEMKKVEKVKCKSEHNNSEQEKFKDINDINHNGTFGTDNSYIPYVSDKNVAAAAADADRHLKKRKDIEANGFSHDDDFRLNKMARPKSCHLSMEENGRKLEHYQTPALLNCERQRQGAATNNKNNHKMDVKEIKLNGSIEAHQPTAAAASSSTKPSAAIAPKVWKKPPPPPPPHPDSKYLNQILSVPKMENWSDDVDDQEWLFNRCGSVLPSSKKPNVHDAVGDSIPPPPTVWAEALVIDSADVSALPYVIPY